MFLSVQYERNSCTSRPSQSTLRITNPCHLPARLIVTAAINLKTPTASAAAAKATATALGEAHTSVQVLTGDNFDEALNDPANGLWLLKFYGKLLVTISVTTTGAVID